MSDAGIMYVGLFCFAMIGLGMGLTVYEFKRISSLPSNAKPATTTLPRQEP